MKVLCKSQVLVVEPVQWIRDLLLPGTNVKHTEESVHMGAYREGRGAQLKW